MKKILLSALFNSIFSALLIAQCTPGANYADSLFGAWPDTLTNFPSGSFGVNYVTDLNFKVPSDAGDIDSAYAGNTIQDFTVDSVVGLPDGLEYTCNIPSCNYLGGANGCAQIFGIPNSSGAHDITIHITANLLIFGFVVPVPYSFEGYHINVNPLGLMEKKFELVTLYPNPAQDMIYLKEESQKMNHIEILDAFGKIVMLKNSDLKELNISTFDKGIYFIKIYFKEKQETVRFVKS